MMITFAEFVYNKRHSLYCFDQQDDSIESLILLIEQKKQELKAINPRFTNKRAKLKAEIAELKIHLRELIDSKRTASSKMPFKDLISLEDTYEKLMALRKKVELHKGERSSKWFNAALQEIKRLESIKPKLIKRRKQELAKKWQEKQKEIKQSDQKMVLFDLTPINQEIEKMYQLYTNTVEFRRQARYVKRILAVLLPGLKQMETKQSEHLFKKYYSVWIDINEALDSANI